MDKRSWPWKKKSSEKAAVIIVPDHPAPSESAANQGNQGKKDDPKKPKYVQISVDTYSHLTGLEDQVKSYEEQQNSYEEQVTSLEEEIKELSEQLTEANTEITAKETLVKQHAKVAEDAVSGWEKAEAEAATLKNHLESVTLLKLTAEDRAAHLDGALKECMRQIRNLKEEHELKIQDVILSKNKQFDKLKLDLEAKISNLDQELLRSAAENAALSRSLQDRSNMLMQLNEEKSEAEAEIEHLKGNIESCEREINTLKYEVHIVTKELEIRNEEKNMSARSAEVANKQHLEGVKKITKLEAECQRLRGLVRKKLPGPAALAQMKLEVESLGRDHGLGDPRMRRSPVKSPVSHLSALPDYSSDSVQKFCNDNQLLTERLLVMEEETKMLKEALAKRNSELQASRSICAKTASKLHGLEAQLLTNGEERSPPKSANPIEGSFSQNASNPPSLTSMSEDGNEDAASCAGSWATRLESEVSHIKKDKYMDSPRKSESTSNLDLMDDFLEMERLACQSNDSNGVVSGTDQSDHNISSIEGAPQPTMQSSLVEQSVRSEVEADPLVKLQSRLSTILESIGKETDIQKVLEDLRHVVRDVSNGLHSQSDVLITEVNPAPGSSNERSSTQIISENASISEEFAASASKIYDFVTLLGKEAKNVKGISVDGKGLDEMLDEMLDGFYASYAEVVDRKTDAVQFLFNLSHVLSKVSELQFNILGYRISESETNNSDCIDKVALPENKAIQEASDGYSNNCTHFSDSGSDPDIPHGGSLVPTSELTATSLKRSMEEFEQLNLEKENLVVDLAKCTENLETAKAQLVETEEQLAEVKSQLESEQKMNGLAETQLKCMAESYKSLEARAEKLQIEANSLREKITNLDNELEEERRSSQDALSRCNDLEEQLQSMKSCPPAEVDTQNEQEKELTAAAEKLAECQETIFLLGKQLKAMRPQPESNGSPHHDRSHRPDSFNEEQPSISGTNLHEFDLRESDAAKSPIFHQAGSESPMDVYNNSTFSPDSDANNTLMSPTSSKPSKHRQTKSGSSSASSTPTPEKHSRGLSRFFSSKGKVGN